MNDINESAFPNEVGNSIAMNGKILGPGKISGGLTKREYFAAQAMHGFISDEDAVCTSGWWKDRAMYIAKKSVEVADALLAELSKK